MTQYFSVIISASAVGPFYFISFRSISFLLFIPVFSHFSLLFFYIFFCLGFKNRHQSYFLLLRIVAVQCDISFVCVCARYSDNSSTIPFHCCVANVKKTHSVCHINGIGSITFDTLEQKQKRHRKKAQKIMMLMLKTKFKERHIQRPQRNRCECGANATE